jgi:hypothetical protein
MSEKKHNGQAVVYVAGPYRAPSEWQVEVHIRNAERLALEVWALGAAAICPHKNTQRFGGAQPDGVWLRGDLAILERCDAVICTGDWERSSGARGEVEHARLRGIPVFFGVEELRGWLNSRR